MMSVLLLKLFLLKNRSMIDVNVFCIIVTYNPKPWIEKCLDSLRNSTIKVNTIVVDNCSSDGSIDIVRDKYPEVHIIQNEKNKGFGQANNQGIEYAYEKGASHFFLLNQDAWLYTDDAIEQLVKVQRDTGINILSPIHYNGKGDLLDGNFYKSISSASTNRNFVSDLIQKTLQPLYMINGVNAAAWFISRATIELIGGFDPLFFHYGEDDNYLHRLKYHGGKIAFVTTSAIYHDRNEHGNIKSYRKNWYRRKLVVQAANINHGMFAVDTDKIYLRALIAKDFLSSFFTLNLGKAWAIFSDVILYIADFRSIVKSRQSNKIKKGNWLNL